MRIQWFFLAPLLLFGATSLHAATIYVDGRRPAEGADGKSWSTAYTTVQAALQAARIQDEVWVAAGTYTPTNAAVRTGVKVYGGFLGTETYRDQRPGLPGLTILMGQWGSGTILLTDGAGVGTVIDGFTLVLPVWSGSPALGLRDTRLTLSHCVITYRPSPTTAPFTFQYRVAGPLVSIEGGSPIISNNIFMDSPGHAIQCVNTTATIVSNTIAGNGTAGVQCTGAASPTLTNNIIAYCQIGVQVDQSATPILRSNCFYENAAGNLPGKNDPSGANGNITADPRFASYELGNLHIQPDSPCVDAGAEDAPHGDLDIDLLPRVMGARVDIGADESDGRVWSVTPRIVRVTQRGDDGNDGGSWATAKRTVQAGINAAAVSGGEVWVAQGTYYGPPPMNRWDAITLPAHVSLYGGFAGTETERDQRDWGRYPTVLTTATKTQSGYIVAAVSGHRTSRVDGFLVMDTSSEMRMNGGIQALGASPVIANNVLTGLAPRLMGGGALYLVGGFPLVFNNAVVANGASDGPAIQFDDSAPTLSHNIISGNSSQTESVINLPRSTTATILNNLIQGNSARINSALATATLFSGSWTRLLVANNTIVGNGPPVFRQFTPYMTIANNIFASNGSPAQPWPLSLGSSIRNNCFYQSGNTAQVQGRDGNIGAYPMFADLRSANYRLQAGSPCVDAGDDSLVPPNAIDLDGEPRIQGRHVDMGAYEFAGAAGAPVMPDVTQAMRIIAGLQAATPDDMAWLNPDKLTPGISLPDAVTLLKALRARSSSME